MTHMKFYKALAASLGTVFLFCMVANDLGMGQLVPIDPPWQPQPGPFIGGLPVCDGTFPDFQKCDTNSPHECMDWNDQDEDPQDVQDMCPGGEQWVLTNVQCPDCVPNPDPATNGNSPWMYQACAGATELVKHFGWFCESCDDCFPNAPKGPFGFCDAIMQRNNAGIWIQQNQQCGINFQCLYDVVQGSCVRSGVECSVEYTGLYGFHPCDPPPLVLTNHHDALMLASHSGPWQSRR